MSSTSRLGIPGQTVTLYARFVDAVGNPVNPDSIPTVAIYDSGSTLKQAATNTGVSLVDDPGLYSFDYNVPLTGAIDGYWTDTWSAKIGNSTVTTSFNFLVSSAGSITQDEAPIFDPGDDVPWDFTKEEAHGINVLLKILKHRLKNDGLRKVPNGSGGYTESMCSIFTDAELISFLVNSLSEFNQTPHFSSFTFADSQIYGIFGAIITQGAVLLAYSAQAIMEKGREFTLNDQGISYQPPQVSEILNSMFGTQLTDYKEKLKYIKNSLKPNPLGLGSYRITAYNPAFLRLRHLRQRRII